MNPNLQPLSSSARERSNWDVLALLRFLLALFIAIFHLSFYTNIGLANYLLKLGPFEVVLSFLLISGYSIGHSISRKREGFLGRRFWRIYPVFLVAMLLTYIAYRQPLTASFGWTILINLLFLGQVLVRTSYLDAGWSLNVEIWLYCLAPFLVRLRAQKLEVLIILSFLFFAAYTCGRTLFHWPYYVGTLYGVNLPALGFIWLAGFYLAVANDQKKRALRLIGFIFLAYLALAIAIQLGYRLKHHELHLFFSNDALGYASNSFLFLIIYLVFRGIIHHQFHLSLFQRRICHFLGDISYPLYLVHFSVYIILSRYCQNPWLLLLAALITASIVYICCDFYSRRRKVT